MMESTQPVLTDPFVLYQSSLLSAYAERLIHGFTGKPLTLGGPQGPDETIWQNRSRLCQAVGLNRERLSLPRQIHGAEFRLNDQPHPEGADAVLLTETGIPAMVQVADCVPVLLYAPDRHAGAAIHAGWRGTAQGITARMARILVEEYQVDATKMLAVIGPAIGACCYEVSDEVSQAVLDTLPGQARDACRQVNAQGKPQIDLKQVNRLQLQGLGVHRIEVMPPCTRCHIERLWSYRRGEDGRQVAFLQLRP